MYLERLALTNFKCFAHQELRLGKITLLLGANSTGKSSLLYGVLAALQSDQFPLSLSANGALVNLGDFRSISHRHRTDHEIAISLRFGGHRLGPVAVLGAFAHSPRTGMPELSSAEIGDPSFSIRVSRGERYNAEWTYNASQDPFRRDLQKSDDLKSMFQAVGRFLQETRRRSAKTQAKTSDETLPEDPLALPPPSGRFAFSTPRDFFKQLGTRYMLLGPHLGALTATLSEFRRSFNYIGSFRLEPRRSYYQVSKGDLRVERDGQNYIEQVAEWQEQKAPQLKQLKQALRRLALLSGLHASRLRSGIFEVKVRPDVRSVPVSLADVGFGIGQLLPILVADIQLPKGGTLAVSQPEIHLHPSVQADLAEYFVRRSSSATNRYIIETHSEYFVNRLRLLVSKGIVKSEDISVVYLSSDGTRSVSHEIVFNPDGRIEGAPKEFFETYMLDVMDIAMAATP